MYFVTLSGQRSISVNECCLFIFWLTFLCPCIFFLLGGNRLNFNINRRFKDPYRLRFNYGGTTSVLQSCKLHFLPGAFELLCFASKKISNIIQCIYKLHMAFTVFVTFWFSCSFIAIFFMLLIFHLFYRNEFCFGHSF